MAGYETTVRQNPTPGDSALTEIWNLLWGNKTAILACAALGAACGLLASSLQPDLYQATALLEIQTLNEDFLNMQQVTPTSSGAGVPARADLQTQVKILNSRSVIEAARKSILSRNAAEVEPDRPSGGFPGSIRRAPLAAAPERVDAIRIASSSLQVRSSDNSRIVEIVCDSTDPRIAALFANAVLDEFIGRDRKLRWEEAQRTEQWLNEQLSIAQGRLEDAERKLRGYLHARGLFFTPQQHGIEEERLRQFQQALSRAQEDRVTRQSRHELANSRVPDALSEVLDDGALQQYQTRLVDLRRQYAELASLYTDEHPRVKQVLAQIRTLEPAIEQERANRISRIHSEFEAARRRENLLASSYREQKDLVLRQADVAVEYSILAGAVETARQIHETLLQRVKQAGLAAALSANPARILDRAAEPLTPYRPNHPLSSAMGLVSGAFLGVVLVFLREQADHRLKRPGDAACYLGLRELGVIHKSAWLAGAGLYRGSTLVLRIAWRRNQAGTSIAPRDSKGESAPLSLELAAWQRKGSRWAESFRALRTSILFQQGGNGLGKSLVVTSPSPGEGKSTIACNLAIAMAETGRRTLLIDADLRQPRLHEVLGFSRGKGLSDLLHSSDLRDSANPQARLPLAGFVRETAVSGLSFLSSGSRNAEAAALLHAVGTEKLLRALEREFDCLVVDTPPLLAVADARVLARFAGAAVVVLRLNESTREQAQLAAGQLVDDGSRLLGLVLNGWKARRGSHGYYPGRYGYSTQPAANPAEKGLVVSA
jgi:capsular exopolysaccharide synthesis family protein